MGTSFGVDSLRFSANLLGRSISTVAVEWVICWVSLDGLFAVSGVLGNARSAHLHGENADGPRERGRQPIPCLGGCSAPTSCVLIFLRDY